MSLFATMLSSTLRWRLFSSFGALKQTIAKCDSFESATKRFLHVSRNCCENYEGDGKTTMTMLNREYSSLVMIDTISNCGFRLNNGLFVFGPVALFPKTVLQWNVNTVHDITPETLSLFCMLAPKLDILVLGTGDRMVVPSNEARDFLKAHRVSVEILSTENASTTFNFLNAEGRCVAGAFIPPSVVLTSDESFLLLDGEQKQLDAFQ